MKHIVHNIHKAYRLLERPERKILWRLSVFSICASLVDVGSISLLALLIAILSGSESELLETPRQFINYFLGGFNDTQYIQAFSLLVLGCFIFRAAIGIVSAYLTTQFGTRQYAKLAKTLFKRVLNYPLGHYSQRNTSALMKIILSETNYLSHVYASLILLGTEVMVFLLLYAFILWANWWVTLLCTLVIGVVAVLVTIFLMRAIDRESAQKLTQGLIQFKYLGGSLHNFRMLKLQSLEESFYTQFSKATDHIGQSYAKMGSLSVSPRYILELVGLGIFIFSLMFIFSVYHADRLALMATFSIFVVTLFRILPSINRIIASLNQLSASSASLDALFTELAQPQEKLGTKHINFTQRIDVKHLAYAYQPEKNVFAEVNMTLKKGDRIKIIGRSGEGKSTFIDILIGLLRPTQGHLSIDGTLLNENNLVSWRNRVGYVPQSVYLFDGSLQENILFGRSYCAAKLAYALEQSAIDFVTDLEGGLDFNVGEGGSRLSGGQRQRVGLARALYGQPALLALDEPTSSLDHETEQAIFANLRQLDPSLTIVIATHVEDDIFEHPRIFRAAEGRIDPVTGETSEA